MLNVFFLSMAVILSFLITWLLGKVLIPYLHKLKYGQTILEIGPSWHKNKQGTPTMGGIMFIIGITITSIILVVIYHFTVKQPFLKNANPFGLIRIFLGILMAVCYGILGFVDDYIKVVKKQNLGLKARQKLIFQFVIAGAYLAADAFTKTANCATSTAIPFIGNINLGVFYWVIMAIIIVGVVNAVNLTDGIDGLNGSVTFFCALFLVIISGINMLFSFSIVSACVAGGCLGFLVWNFHPAKVFMGDTGSLFLGGMICTLVFGINLPVLIIPIAIVYLLEMFSVILQVLYFKATKGKRLFKMSPVHHHFEMCGWKESKICIIFSAVSIFGGLLALILSLSLIKP